MNEEDTFNNNSINTQYNQQINAQAPQQFQIESNQPIANLAANASQLAPNLETQQIINEQNASKFQLLNLLSRATSATISQKERGQVDEQLKMLGTVSMKQHVHDLCEIVGSKEIPMENPLKDHAAIYLKNYLRSALGSSKLGIKNDANKNQKKNKINHKTATIFFEDLLESLQFCSEVIIKLILSQQVKGVRKKNIQNSLEMLLLTSQKKIGLKRKNHDKSINQKGNSQNVEQLNLLKEIFNYLNNNFLKNLNNDTQLFNEVITIYGALIISCMQKNLLVQILGQGLSAFLQPINQIQQALFAKLPDMVQNQCVDYQKQIKVDIISMIDALTQWVDIYFQAMSMNKFKSQHGKANQDQKISNNVFMLYFAQSEELCNVFVSLLKLGSQVQNIVKNIAVLPDGQDQNLISDQLISVIGINDLDIALNQLTSKVFSCLKNIWLFIYQQRPKEIIEQKGKVNLYIQQGYILQKDIVASLKSIVKYDNYEHLQQNGNISDIIKSSIKIISCFTKEAGEHKPFFIEISFEIFLEIIMPVLKVTSEELMLITENPEEFVNSSNDICDERSSKNIKCLAADLLIDLSSNVDGMQTFIFDTCFSILENLMQKSNIQSQQYINQIMQKFNLKFKNDQEVIEVTLMIVSILSDPLYDRLDLQTSMGRVFQNLTPILLDFPNKPQIGQQLMQISQNFSSPLTQQRICMLISLSFENMFSNLNDADLEVELPENVVCWLFETITEEVRADNKQISKVVVLQALETLDRDLQKFENQVQTNFDHIIDQLAKANANQKHLQYFEFLEDFIRQYHGVVTLENLKTFMISLVNRVLNEQTFINSQHQKFQEDYQKSLSSGGLTLNLSKNQIYKKTQVLPEKRMKTSKAVQAANQRIGKCINVIRFIVEHEYFKGPHIEHIEQMIRPLLLFATRLQDIDFEDDLIFCIDALIKKSKACSPIIQETFPYLKNFQDQYDGMLANLTSCLNAYIVFGNEFIEKSEQNIQEFLNIISKTLALQPQAQQFGMNYSNNIEACLVLSVAFQNFHYKDPQSAFYQKVPHILNGIVDILKKQPVSQCFKRNLCEIILSAIIYDHGLTLQALHELQFLDTFFQLIFDPSVIYRSNYERKLFIFAICILIFQSGPQNIIIQANLAELLKQVICMLIRQQRIEQNRKVQLEKQLLALQANTHKRKAQSYLVKKDNGMVKSQPAQRKSAPQRKDDEEPPQMADLHTFDNEYQNLLPELKQKEEPKSADAKPLFKITIPMNEEAKMQDDAIKSEDSDSEDQVQDFIQEEYDLKLLVQEGLITRIDHQSILRHFQTDSKRPPFTNIQNEFEDEFLYFNSHIRQVFNQNSQSFNDMVENKLEPQIREYLKIIVQSQRVNIQDVEQSNDAPDQQQTIYQHNDVTATQSRRIVKVKRKHV